MTGISATASSRRARRRASSIVPVAVGLFGLGREILRPERHRVGNVISPKLRDLLPTRQEWKESAMPITRGTLLGFIIGIIRDRRILFPASCPTRWKNGSPGIRGFGKGAVAGVAGPETANNAASTGALRADAGLGIPTSPITAELIGALMLHGHSSGRRGQRATDVFWGFVASMYVGT